MTLIELDDGDRLRLVACPFCDADLRDTIPAVHLRACDAYREAWGLDVSDPRRGGA